MTKTPNKNKTEARGKGTAKTKTGGVNKSADKTKSKRMDPVKELRRLGRREPELVDHWAKDPAPRDQLRMMVRAAMDFQKLRIACSNREASPTSTNPAQLVDSDMAMLAAIGSGTEQLEKAVKDGMKYYLRQSEIGRWLLEQPGLRSGWLGGYILSEFPDIYDAAICVSCGRYLRRLADMTYYHPAPPERKSGDSKEACEFDDTIMVEANYRMHERKPSTFVKFAGLATEPGWACPDCGYLLRGAGKAGLFKHPGYTNLPKGMQKCVRSGRVFVLSEDEQSCTDREDGELAASVNCSPKRTVGKKNSFKSSLRAKLIGPNGVADAFIMQQHPKYYKIYADYKHRVTQRDPWRSGKWIDYMSKRAMMYRFIVDFFIKWRETEGLPVRPPYEEEKLGIRHHD